MNKKLIMNYNAQCVLCKTMNIVEDYEGITCIGCGTVEPIQSAYSIEEFITHKELHDLLGNLNIT
jgi:hypothetical protein